jgi:hypothetical protein
MLLVSWNPLPWLYEMTSFQVEVLATPHVGIVVNPQLTTSSTHYSRTSDNNYTASIETLNGGSAELGVRIYAPKMSRGTAAFFVSPSAILGRYAWTTTYTGSGFLPSANYNRFGVALDTAVSYIAPFGLTISGGVGVQYAKNLDADPAWGIGSGPADGFFRAVFFGSGLRPRLLLAVGWGF